MNKLVRKNKDCSIFYILKGNEKLFNKFKEIGLETNNLYLMTIPEKSKKGKLIKKLLS